LVSNKVAVLDLLLFNFFISGTIWPLISLVHMPQTPFWKSYKNYSGELPHCFPKKNKVAVLVDLKTGSRLPFASIDAELEELSVFPVKSVAQELYFVFPGWILQFQGVPKESIE
jgi:hypothetical protein